MGRPRTKEPKPPTDKSDWANSHFKVWHHNHIPYTPEIGTRICDGIIAGISMKKICNGEDGMPKDPNVVYLWLAKGLLPDAPQHFVDFRKGYYEARNLMPDALVAQCLDIADDTENDFTEKTDRYGNVTVVPNNEAILRTRLRVDTRMRLAGLLCSRYSETKRIDVTTNGESLNKPSEEQMLVAKKRLVIELMRMQGGEVPKVDMVDAEYTMDEDMQVSGNEDAEEPEE